MTWVKLDDAFAEHPKIVGLSDGAFRLLVAAFCYCGRWNTDGVVPKTALKMPRRCVNELVSRGNWHAAGHECETCPPVANDAYYVHEFLVYNPSAEEVETAQERRSEKARKAARARWEKRPSLPPSSANGNTPSMLGAVLPDAPVPTVSSSPSTSEPPHPQAVDDEEELIVDEIETTAVAVLERVAGVRMTGIAPNQPGAYRDRVIANLEHERGTELRHIIETHPTAPVQTLAGWMLGEPNSLASYRKADA